MGGAVLPLAAALAPAARRRAVLAAALAALVTVPAARADDTHYQDILVGGRAVGLGGAFTSIADDPSGAYYNPAGLADARSTNLQISTSLYGFERGSISQGLVTPVPGADDLHLEFTDLIIIPASAGFVKTFGGNDEGGKPYQACGLSVVVPSFRSFTAGARGDTTTPDDATDPSEYARFTRTYQRRVTDRDLWTGAGCGRRFTSNLRLGVSAYYVLRSVSDREQLTESERVPAPDPSTPSPGDRFETITNDISIISGSLVLIAGARYTLTPRLALGASVASPSWPLHSKATLAFSRAAADPVSPGGPSASLENLSIAGESRVAFAPRVRLGASYARPYTYTLSADVSYHAPVSYALVAPKRGDQDQFDAYLGRLPFVPRIHRRAVVNLNVGGEFLIVREVSIAGGFFTDFSSAPRIPASPRGDMAPDVNLFGLSMAMGYFGDHTLSRLGVTYSFGTGHDVIPEGESGTLAGQHENRVFRRVHYFQSFFYVFLSNVFRY